MAKTTLGGPLIGALFNSVTPPAEDKKRAVKPRKNKTTKGEASATEHGQQHGELANSKQPSESHMIKQEAKRQKRQATENWIAGRVSTAQHEHVHRRANHVLTNQPPRAFKGKTGEKSKSGLW